MSTLSSLKKSISEMSTEELHEHLRQLRLQRRTYKPKKKSNSTSARGAHKKAPTDTLAALTPEMAQALLDQLES